MVYVGYFLWDLTNLVEEIGKASQGTMLFRRHRLRWQVMLKSTSAVVIVRLQWIVVALASMTFKLSQLTLQGRQQQLLPTTMIKLVHYQGLFATLITHLVVQLLLTTPMEILGYIIQVKHLEATRSL